MKYHKIEVDEEVYRYLLGKVQDFEDTPNMILRRELLDEESGGQAKKERISLPDFPSGIPVALQHTLEVIFLVKRRGFSRVDATKAVAKRHKVRRETVLDKYGRQLNQTTNEVDKLLQDENLSKFKQILLQKFSDHKTVIEDFFNGLIKNERHSGFSKNEHTSDVKQKGYVSLETLKNRGNELVKSKPKSVIINQEKYRVNTWTEFDKVVVNWLMENGLLNQSDLPIYATDNKYFINSKPIHTEASYDGKWEEIEEGVYMDSKYNAPSHIRNILNLKDQLSLQDKCKISLSVE